jgi:hypothetical protein
VPAPCRGLRGCPDLKAMLVVVSMLPLIRLGLPVMDVQRPAQPLVRSLHRVPERGPVARVRRSKRSDWGTAMDDDTERADLERRISESGWHILRDEEVGDGYIVEFQQGSYTEHHPGAETWVSQGSDRNDAYRRFLEEVAGENLSGGKSASA